MVRVMYVGSTSCLCFGLRQIRMVSILKFCCSFSGESYRFYCRGGIQDCNLFRGGLWRSYGFSFCDW